MNIAELSARFEFYAAKNKSINHDANSKLKGFLQVDVQDVQVSIKNGIKFPCLLLQTPEVEKDGGIDNITEHYEGSFVVLQQCDVNQTAAFKMNLLYECKLICDQIFNRMIVDSDEYFEGAQIKTSEGSFGPIAGGVYGWGVNFGFEQGYNGELNPDDWEDLA